MRSFILVREILSVFVYTVSQDDFLNHTENCFWLGPELKLNFQKWLNLHEVLTIDNK